MTVQLHNALITNKASITTASSVLGILPGESLNAGDPTPQATHIPLSTPRHHDEQCVLFVEAGGPYWN